MQKKHIIWISAAVAIIVIAFIVYRYFFKNKDIDAKMSVTAPDSEKNQFYLPENAEGQKVINIQDALMKKGYEIEVTGKLNQATKDILTAGEKFKLPLSQADYDLILTKAFWVAPKGEINSNPHPNRKEETVNS